MVSGSSSPIPGSDLPTNIDINKLYEERTAFVYRYHLARTGDPEAAEALTAYTFRTALTDFRFYTPEDGSPAAWLMTIALERLTSYLRKGHSGRDQPVQYEGAAEGGALPDTRDELLRRLEMARIAAALRQMNPRQADGVALHYFGGLSLAEIGQVLGVSEEAARRITRRALADLRTRLTASQERNR